ncbi:TerC family protein [Pseudonocardia yuanmonensis]|uniref:TerC family protein n=1 Tax=Pseudonocardia yuanmonensis TaxID=1095914 RepID=A0ABP8WMU0_9PSEU
MPGSLSTTWAAPTGPVGSPVLWATSLAVLLALLTADFLLTRRPHTVQLPEAVGWSVFYLALPGVFGLFLWGVHGGAPALEFATGFVVEKSLSVDNLFVFVLLLGAFAVPAELAQRVLLFGIVGALALRGVLIGLGAALVQAGTWAFLVFGAILFGTAAKLLRELLAKVDREPDVSTMRSVRLLRRLVPVTDGYRGSRLVVREQGRRALTPLSVVVVAVLATDVVFAVDSVPAVYGVTEDPYLVFATNAFALLGLRALYFVLSSVLGRLRYLNHGLVVILALIGVKLVLHWAHGVWPAVPEIPTPASLGLIVLILTVVTVASLRAAGRPSDELPTEG